MFCKFYRKTVKRAFVQADDESFHYLLGQQFEVTKVAYFVVVE
jgi:hypothetical protein